MDFGTPQTPPRGWSKDKRILSLVGILVLIILIVVAGLFLAPVSKWIALSTVPAELRSAVFVGEKGNTFAAYQAQDGHLTEVPFAASAAFVYAARGDGKTVTTEFSGGMYHLMENGTELYATSTPIYATSVAPNGLAIGITIAPDLQPSASAAALTINPATSEAGIFYIPTKRVLVVSRGSSPLFLDNNNLTYLTAYGLFTTDLTTSQTEPLLQKAMPSVTGPFLLSPDRTLIASVGSGSLTIYRLAPSTFEGMTPTGAKIAVHAPGAVVIASTTPSGFKLTTVGSFPTGESYSLLNTDFYESHTSWFGTTFYRYSFAKGAKGSQFAGYIAPAFHITNVLP